MRTIFGVVGGGGVLLFSLLMMVGSIGAALDGAIAANGAVIVFVLFAGLAVIGALLVRWGLKKPAPPTAQLLTEQGQLVSLPTSLLPPGATVGSVVAMTDLKGAVTLPEGEPKAMLARGDAALAQRRFAEAYGLYEAAVRGHADAAAIGHANMGACCFMLGDYDRAIQLYTLAKQQGANPLAMDENIVEAQQAKAKRGA